MNNIGVIGGADGETVIMVSGSIAPPILWIFFGALALMVILYFRSATCLILAIKFPFHIFCSIDHSSWSSSA